MILEQKKNRLIEYWRRDFDFTNEELEAFREVKRENFVIDDMIDYAYEDTPLPLVRGKTISQPTTVMMMTSALEINPGEKIFEVGTGSGYQAALLAKLTGENGKIFSTEVIPELVIFSKNNFAKSGIKNIEVHEIDGSKGLAKEAPFDKIIITAACRDFPQILIDQLKVDGFIIAPVGNKDEQTMIRGRKLENGRLELEFLGPFLFTPMYGEYGFEI
ncbi:protein-L-isoaspartate(D-aspartate) O-methyltransferase [Candidatus Woesearchaeota archaeon]|nr:protein-L-isoaspartate(D-aspartate) O-methyltransferase [Candidatus Woesearchaeota archaeon]